MGKLEKCAVSAVVKHGFDGQPPLFASARGTEVRDPVTGRIIRDAIDGPQNINVDRLEFLKYNKKIEQYQLDAGRTLQRDWEISTITSYSRVSDVGGGSGTQRLPDAKCDAMDRFNRAYQALGGVVNGNESNGWKIVKLVVLDSSPIGEAEETLNWAKGNGMGALRTALDILAKHYGLAT